MSVVCRFESFSLNLKSIYVFSSLVDQNINARFYFLLNRQEKERKCKKSQTEAHYCEVTIRMLISLTISTIVSLMLTECLIVIAMSRTKLWFVNNISNIVNKFIS